MAARKHPLPPRKPRDEKPIATRDYRWRPPVGQARKVEVAIFTPKPVGPDEWASRLRIIGLPRKVDQNCHGMDAVQALELALIASGKLLSGSPQFRAGQIELWDEPIRRPAALFLPLPMQSLQGSLENLQAFTERKLSESRRTDWGSNLVAQMREIAGDLATLAAHLPMAPKPKRAAKPRRPR